MPVETDTKAVRTRSALASAGRSALVWVYPLIDLSCALVAFYIAYAVRIVAGTGKFDLNRVLDVARWWGDEQFRAHLSIAIVMAVFLVAMLFQNKLYSFNPGVRYSHEALGTLRGLLWMLGFGVVVSFAFERFVISRLILVIYVGFCFPLLFSWRFALRKLAERLYARGMGRTNVLIVGLGPVPRQVKSLLEERPWLGLRVVGFLGEPGLPARDEILGTLDDFDRILEEKGIAEVYFAASIDRDRMVTMAQNAQRHGLTVKLIPDLLDLLSRETEYESLGGITVARLFCPTLTVGQRAVKRVLDVIIGVILGIVFTPIMLLSALFVRIGSRGPVIFRQTRIGENGRHFVLFKFRSMRIENDDSAHRELVGRMIRGEEPAEEGKVFKLTNDPRITPIGRILRKFHFDELPQLWNVLRGDLSMVGPRPPLQFEYEQYEEFFKKRMLIKPGVTGLWQVSGKYHLSFEQMVMLDLRYINEWSIWLDIRILLETVPQMLRGSGK